MHGSPPRIARGTAQNVFEIFDCRIDCVTLKCDEMGGLDLQLWLYIENGIWTCNLSQCWLR